MPETLTYSLQDACRVSGIGKTTLRRYIAEGRIDARACGGKTLVMAESLRDFLTTLPKVTAKSPDRIAQIASK